MKYVISCQPKVGEVNTMPGHSLLTTDGEVFVTKDKAYAEDICTRWRADSDWTYFVVPIGKHTNEDACP